MRPLRLARRAASQQRQKTTPPAPVLRSSAVRRSLFFSPRTRISSAFSSSSSPSRLEALRRDLAAGGGPDGFGAGEEVAQFEELNPLKDSVTASFPSLAGKTFAIETYGCQMNEADTGIVAAVLAQSGMRYLSPREEKDVNSCSDLDSPSNFGSNEPSRVGVEAADVVLLNTCAVREKVQCVLRPPPPFFLFDFSLTFLFSQFDLGRGQGPGAPQLLREPEARQGERLSRRFPHRGRIGLHGRTAQEQAD
jgi:Uncharacterized protein family UPF0004